MTTNVALLGAWIEIFTDPVIAGHHVVDGFRERGLWRKTIAYFDDCCLSAQCQAIERIVDWAVMFLGAKATGEVDNNRGIRGRSRGIADPDSALIVCNEMKSG